MRDYKSGRAATDGQQKEPREKIMKLERFLVIYFRFIMSDTFFSQSINSGCSKSNYSCKRYAHHLKA